MQKELTFEKFGDYLKRKRDQLGISQAELAAKTGIDRTYLSMLENRGNPAFNKIKQMAEAMSISLEEFFRAIPNEAKQPLIQVFFDQDQPIAGSKKLKEHLLQFSSIPIPIIDSKICLASKIIEDDHIKGYIAVDTSVLPIIAGEKIVFWKDSKYSLVMLNINETELEDGQTYLVEINDTFTVKKLTVANGGSFLRDPLDSHDSDIIILTGKKKESLNVLGRVLRLTFDV